MTFNPARSHGASIGRFLSYLNRILLNQFISLEKKQGNDPVARRDTLRINDEEQNERANEVSLEQLHYLG